MCYGLEQFKFPILETLGLVGASDVYFIWVVIGLEFGLAPKLDCVYIDPCRERIATTMRKTLLLEIYNWSGIVEKLKRSV